MNGLARIRELELEKKSIETPILWITSSIKEKPIIWKELPVRNLMLNTLDLIKSCKEAKIKKKIGFSGNLFLDSGGFKLTRKQPKIILENVIRYQINSDADLLATLDIPLDVNDTNYIQKIKINKCIELAKIYAQRYDKRILPVIHGHDYSTLKFMLKKLSQMFALDKFCIGGLVPLLYPTKFNKIKELIKILIRIRQEYKNSFIHVFGAGGALTMHLFIYVGFDSVDTSSWIVRAGYGKIHLPGLGEAYIQPETGRPNKIRYIDWQNYHCECPVCKNKDPEIILPQLNSRTSHGRILRAIHNAWVYLHESELIKERIKEGTYEEFLDERFKNTNLYKIYKEIKSYIRLRRLDTF